MAVWPFMFVLYLPYIAEYILAIIEEKTAKKYGKEVKQEEKITITKRTGTKHLIIIMLICMLTGFLIPLGTTPYTYLLKTMQGETTQHINEHLPMILINAQDILSVVIIFLAIFTFTKTKIRLTDLFMITGLALLMLYSKRQLTMFIIIGSIILNRLIYDWGKSWIHDLEEQSLGILTTKLGAFYRFV